MYKVNISFYNFYAFYGFYITYYLMSDSRPNFPKMEEELLASWDERKIFEKTLQKLAPKGRFVFFEGPPTANGRPGIHHVEARAFKDCIPRFRTMQGYLVERKAGWDTHGLPVELEVEKQLGFTGKKDIEAFGIAEFNKHCKESVWKYLADWQQITRRIGFWLDLEHPYVTYEPAYVESLWWVIKQIWDKGLLYQDYRVTPHCPRCGTSLSSHELAQGYKDVEDPAVYVKFRVTKRADGSVPNSEEPEYLVAWTTTPWTLPSNVALAVGGDIQYILVKKFILDQGIEFVSDGNEFPKVRGHHEYYWLAKDRVEEATSGSYEIVEERHGHDLVGMEYEPLYPFAQDAMKGTDQESKQAWYVVPADFVSTTDGSGIVHTAVMYGADDFELGTKLGLPKYHLVGLDGRFTQKAGPFAGLFVKDADPKVLEDLASRNLLLRQEKVKHTYPFCWRCKSPLIYYAKDSWYIRMSGLRDEMLAANAGVKWEPEYIQDGRFGEWLREIKDWAFSRERYWGTPLPIWVCEACGEKSCVGSFEEIRSRSFSPVAHDFDPHRPFVDDIVLRCDKCGGSAKRIAEVCDVWFDSGAMPFAQWHYPFENRERIDENLSFPADYISEAIDQTRGWFYTLLAVSTLLGKGRPYKSVICLGHVLDAKGKKMSKSIGNVVNPMEVINQFGADAVRWYMYTINQPGDAKRFDLKTLDEMVKKVFMILWNVMTFYEMYESEGVRGMQEVQGAQEGQVEQGGHVLDQWIMARLYGLVAETTSRMENNKVTESARDIADFINDLSTWYLRRSRDRFKGSDEEDKTHALATLRMCLLTITKLMAPFTPFLADAMYLRLSGGKDSVHLEDWPVIDETYLNEDLLKSMGQTRSIVSRLLEKRAEAGRPVRQALSSATITIPEGSLADDLVALIKDEVNVKKVFVEKGEYAVDLDMVLTPELLREGMVRELVRRVNDLRKKSGLTIEDRIELFVSTSASEMEKALEEYKEILLTSTLALELCTTGDAPEIQETLRINECDLVIGFVKQ